MQVAKKKKASQHARGQKLNEKKKAANREAIQI